MWRQVYIRLRSLWRWRNQESELDDEIRFHLAEEIEERIAAGMSPEQARASARRDFGNVPLVRELTREAWGWGGAERLLQDVGSALRTMRRNPAFSVSMVSTIALGIGTVTVAYAVIEPLLLRPVPYRDADSLYELAAAGGVRPRGRFVPPAHLASLRDQTSVFQAVDAYHREVWATPRPEPRLVEGAWVTPGLFENLGVDEGAQRRVVPAAGGPGARASPDLRERGEPHGRAVGVSPGRAGPARRAGCDLVPALRAAARGVAGPGRLRRRARMGLHAVGVGGTAGPRCRRRSTRRRTAPSRRTCAQRGVGPMADTHEVYLPLFDDAAYLETLYLLARGGDRAVTERALNEQLWRMAPGRSGSIPGGRGPGGRDGVRASFPGVASRRVRQHGHSAGDSGARSSRARLDGGSDFYARDIAGLRREGETSRRVFLDVGRETASSRVDPTDSLLPNGVA